MAVSLLDHATASSSFSTDTAPGNKTHTVTKPVAAVTDTYVIVCIAFSIPGTSIDTTVTAPAGWTTLTSGFKGGTPSVRFGMFGKFMASGEASSWAWTYTVASNVLSHTYTFSGVNTTTPTSGAGWLAQAASNTSRITPSITVDGTQFVAYGTHDRNASNPTLPDATGKVNSTHPADVSLTTGYVGIVSAATFSKTATGAASTSVAGSFIVAVNQASGGDVDGTLDLGVTVSIDFHERTAVEKWLSQRPLYAAHRGGSADWFEESEYAYDQAAAWNPDLALEVSLWRSSNGVWVASHDRTTARLFPTSLDIPTSTWSALSALTSTSGYKLARLDDILTAHNDGTRVFFLDNKQDTTDTGTALLDVMDANGGPGVFIAKGGGTAQAFWGGQAFDRGYQTWGYYYDTDVDDGELPDTDVWTILGMDVLAGTADDFTVAASYGKPVLAHIVATATQKTTATGYGADGFMASGVMEVVPQEPKTGALDLGINVTLAFTGTVERSGSVAFSIDVGIEQQGTTERSGTLELDATARIESAGFTERSGTLDLAATPSVDFNGSGDLSATVALPASVGLGFTGTTGRSSILEVPAIAGVGFVGHVERHGNLSNGLTVTIEFEDRSNQRDITLVSIPGTPRWASIPGSNRWAAIPEDS